MSEAQTKVKVHVDKVNKSYGSNHVLRDISLDINENEKWQRNGQSVL